MLSATARASRPAVTPRDPRGSYPRGPCYRQSLCSPSACDTRGLLHGSLAALSHAEMERWEFAAHRRRAQRAEGGAVDERTGSGRLGREERRGGRAHRTRPTGARSGARWRNAMNAAARRPGERRGGGTRGLRPHGARGVRCAAAHVRGASVTHSDATTATLDSGRSRSVSAFTRLLSPLGSPPVSGRLPRAASRPATRWRATPERDQRVSYPPGRKGVGDPMDRAGRVSVGRVAQRQGSAARNVAVRMAKSNRR
jgi:hypothetical protein